MRFQAARMHKKAVRRARHERHRSARERYRIKPRLHASSRFVASHSRARKSRPSREQRTAAHVRVSKGAWGKCANGIFLALWLLAITLPTALNLHQRRVPHTAIFPHEIPTRPFRAEQAAPRFAPRANVLMKANENVAPNDFPAALQPRSFPPKLNGSLPLADIHEDLPKRALTPHVPMAATPSIHKERLLAVHAATIGAGLYGLHYMNGIFGGIAQPFKVGSDWHKDRFLHFDELLHVQGAYRITQAVSGVYQWAGVKPQHADWIGAGTAAALMTTMEYIDGRRKNDEASYSDFAANFLGVGFALAKARWQVLQDFDLRLSYRTLSDPLDRHRMKRYDRMTHWLTYDLHRRLRLPLHVGVGYSVARPGTRRAQAEYFFGVGISPQALLKQIFPSAAPSLKWLDLYHFGNQVQINSAAASPRKSRRNGR